MSDVETLSDDLVVTKRSGKKETTNRPSDRITIGPDALLRLNQFLEQSGKCLRGIKLSKNELVNFLILNHCDTLSSSELKELENKYFDEVKFAQWALSELKAAKARGEAVTFANIVSKVSSKPRVSRVKKLKPEVVENTID